MPATATSSSRHLHPTPPQPALSPSSPPRSVVQRLQRFATYGHLKQLVLRIIADELGTHSTMQQESQDLVDNLTTLFQELDSDSNGTGGCGWVWWGCVG